MLHLAQAAPVLADVGILTFVVGTMAALGLRLTIGQVVGPLKSPRLLAGALVANFVLVPALAWALWKAIPMPEGYGIGLLLMAMAAGAPFIPPLVQLAGGAVAMSVGVMVLLMVGTVVYLPLALPLVLPGVSVNPVQIAGSLVVLMLIPLGIGLWVNNRYPAGAARAERVLDRVAKVGMVVGFGSLLWVNGAKLLGTFGSGAVAAAAVLAVGALACGWLLAGKARQERGVLGLATAARNVPAALVVADTSFEDSDVLVMCLVTAMIGLVVMLIAAKIMRRRGVSESGDVRDGAAGDGGPTAQG